jgi:hypothetical protein
VAALAVQAVLVAVLLLFLHAISPYLLALLHSAPQELLVLAEAVVELF